MSLQPVPDAESQVSFTVNYRPTGRFWLTEGAEAELDELDAADARREQLGQAVGQQQTRQRRRTRGLLRQVVGDGPERHHKPEAQLRADTERQQVSR